MKKYIAVFILLFMSSLPAFAEDECLLPLDAIKPVMREDAPGYSVKIDEEARTITESVTLEEGLKITYAAGGCSHFSYTFHFENIPGGAKEMPVDPFGLPQSLLRRVPMRDETEFQHMRETLWEKEAEGYAAFDEEGRTDWGCGDAFCHLILKGSQDVTLGYDFAL